MFSSIESVGDGLARTNPTSSHKDDNNNNAKTDREELTILFFLSFYIYIYIFFLFSFPPFFFFPRSVRGNEGIVGLELELEGVGM